MSKRRDSEEEFGAAAQNGANIDISELLNREIKARLAAESAKTIAAAKKIMQSELGDTSNLNELQMNFLLFTTVIYINIGVNIVGSVEIAMEEVMQILQEAITPEIKQTIASNSGLSLEDVEALVTQKIIAILEMAAAVSAVFPGPVEAPAVDDSEDEDSSDASADEAQLEMAAAVSAVFPGPVEAPAVDDSEDEDSSDASADEAQAIEDESCAEASAAIVFQEVATTKGCLRNENTDSPKKRVSFDIGSNVVREVSRWLTPDPHAEEKEEAARAEREACAFLEEVRCALRYGESESDIKFLRGALASPLMQELLTREALVRLEHDINSLEMKIIQGEIAAAESMENSAHAAADAGGPADEALEVPANVAAFLDLIETTLRNAKSKSDIEFLRRALGSPLVLESLDEEDFEALANAIDLTEIAIGSLDEPVGIANPAPAADVNELFADEAGASAEYDVEWSNEPDADVLLGTPSLNTQGSIFNH